MGNTVFGAVLASVMKIGEELTAIHQVQVSNGVGVVKQLHQSIKNVCICGVVCCAMWCHMLYGFCMIIN